METVDKKIEEIVKSLKGKPELTLKTPRFIKTGNPLIDYVFGKGIPIGRVVEIFGEEGTGKSTLAYQILAEVYLQGGIPILFDAEESFDSERGKQLGLTKLIVETPRTIEEGFALLEKVMDKIKEKDFGVVVWDSLSATPPETFLKGKVEIGARARAISLELQKSLSKFYNSNLSLIVLNQVRSVIQEFGFGNRMYDSMTARALRHEAIIRAELKKLAKLEDKDKGVVYGILVSLETMKNKVVSPFRKVKLVLFFNTGFSIAHSVVLNAIEQGIVKQLDGGYYEYNGKKFRKLNLKTLTKSDFDKLVDDLIKSLKERDEEVYRRIGIPSP